MADGAFVKVVSQYGTNGIFANPLYNFHPDDYVAPLPSTGSLTRQTVPLTSTALTLPTTYNALQSVIIKNNDIVNYVEIAFTYTAASSTVYTNRLRLDPGGIQVLTGAIRASVAVTAQAFGAPVVLDIMAIAQ